MAYCLIKKTAVDRDIILEIQQTAPEIKKRFGFCSWYLGYIDKLEEQRKLGLVNFV
jgi:hypothetical protein